MRMRGCTYYIINTMRKIFLGLLALCATCVSAQLTVTPNPVEAGYKGQIVIIYDATKGNGALASATAVYAHTGLITSASNNDSDWKNVKGTYGSTSQPKLTSLGNKKWQLVIDNMYSFYGVSESTDIKALAFVFHDGTGQKAPSGKTASGGDIFIWIGEDNTDTDIWATVEGLTPTEQARPAGVSNGIYYDESDPTKVTLCMYAATKQNEPANRVFLLGDMTDWKLDAAHQLYKDGNYFWITLTGLEPGKEYRFQYAVERSDGVKKQLCDLYSEKVIHPDDKWEPKKADPTLIGYPKSGADGGYVTVIQTQKPAFEWSDATLNFKRPDKNNLVIYELWVFDYTPTRTINGVRQRLDYLKQLGVNAIELMPISEFEGNKSWGYNPTLYFAPDRAYGSENDIKTFIDECHQHGIAVILDMVFNHTTGQNPMAKLYPYGTELDTYNPWFVPKNEVKHSDNDYGEDWNHDFGPAHEMFTRVFQHWLKEYKVDGFRLDLSHGLCGGTKYNAPENLKDYYQNGVQAVSPGAYMILEHWGNNANNDRPGLIEAGMLCWLNTNNAYCQVTMGWLKDGDALTAANADGLVTYAESHDEERMQYKCTQWGNGKVKTDFPTRIGRVPAAVAMNVLLNGSHMLWQFEEIGYDFSINSNIDHPYATSGGRVDPKPRPENAGYFHDPYRVKAYEKCAQAIQLRTALHPEWFEGNPTAQKLGAGQKVRYVQWGGNVYVVANFDLNAQNATLPDGTWYDYYAGGTQTSGTISLQAGEVKIFTGIQVPLPEINLDLESLLPIEKVQADEMPKATKILRDGQVLILRGDNVYDLMGRFVK